MGKYKPIQVVCISVKFTTCLENCLVGLAYANIIENEKPIEFYFEREMKDNDSN